VNGVIDLWLMVRYELGISCGYAEYQCRKQREVIINIFLQLIKKK